MTADKRDFSDFTAFGGEIREGSGMYQFPMLYTTTKRQQLRQWSVFVRLVRVDDKQISSNWLYLNEHHRPIFPRYFTDNTPLPAGIIAEVWTESGIYGKKITRHIPTYISTIANVGRSNQRNQFQSALIVARGKYLKYMHKGGKSAANADADIIQVVNAMQNTTIEIEEKAPGHAQISSSVPVVGAMYFPMLARKWKEWERRETRLRKRGEDAKYPMVVQPKLNGNRCLAYLLEKDGGPDAVRLYSRNCKVFPKHQYMQQLLYPFLNAYFVDGCSLYLDGEFYCHGESLQRISSRARSSKVSKVLNEYHIYDCFYPRELARYAQEPPGAPFSDRLVRLEAFHDMVAAASVPGDAEAPGRYIKRVYHTYVASESEAWSYFNKFITDGFEGAMLRNLAAPYLGDAMRTGTFLRSYGLTKMKRWLSAEFEVIGYANGDGKDAGIIIWILRTAAGNEFRSKYKGMTYKQMREIYREVDATQGRGYIGTLMTVEYAEMSDSGTPQHTNVVAIRDYE